MQSFRHAAAFAALLAGPAFAETMDVSGTGTGEASNEVMAVSEGLVAIRAQSMYDGFTSDNADNPFATASGPCWGSILIDKGAVSGGGLCHYTVADGGVAIIRWTPEAVVDNRTQGTWELVGGTGAFTDATGGGSFDAGTGADGRYTNNTTGTLTMP